MKVIMGDLLKFAKDGKFDVILHGCNCFNAMGAGIARQIASTYPAAYRADSRTKAGDKFKLGTITYATVGSITIVNCYTQYDYRGERAGLLLADYTAIRNCFRNVRFNFSGKRIGYPKIGAGLANGDWDIISKIIEEELFGEDHTLVEYCK